MRRAGEGSLLVSSAVAEPELMTHLQPTLTPSSPVSTELTPVGGEPTVFLYYLGFLHHLLASCWFFRNPAVPAADHLD